MPKVSAAPGQNIVNLDDGVVVRPNSAVDVDITKPLAVAALAAVPPTIIVLDADPAAPSLDSRGIIIGVGDDLTEAEARLVPSTFALWLDDTPGATVMHFVAKDSAGTIRQGSVALA